MKERRGSLGSHDRPALIGALNRALPGRVSTDPMVLRQHANTLTSIASEPADVVVWPQTADEVQAIVRVAAEAGAPVIPFGAGTSLEGHVNAPYGGISLDMRRMNRILETRFDDRTCTVEAGLSRRDLNRHLEGTGLFFAVDSGAAEATIGGLAATGASGTATIRYGGMRDNVRALTAVMADGTLIRTGGRARKSSAGYDLTHLLVGSEGTLGLLTEITIRLFPIPEAIAVLACSFPSVRTACEAVIAALGLDLGLARIELLDASLIAAVNAEADVQLPRLPALFIELHGSAVAVEHGAPRLADIARAFGASVSKEAVRAQERETLWRARHDAFWAIRSAWPGKTVLVTDVCVPLSRLAGCIDDTEADVRESGLTAPILGHVGDGNFHVIPVFDGANAPERERVAAFAQRLVRRALALGGTCTGEHGIGQGKRAYLADEHGAAVAVMRRIKESLDPLDILNPGKIFETESTGAGQP